MTNIGLPVPRGLRSALRPCLAYLKSENQFPDGMLDQTYQALKELEEKTGKIFGDKNNPLLVSVRSGAAVSMPGMMDTILNGA
jgi:pyruvate,orthophosphate dikinase